MSDLSDEAVAAAARAQYEFDGEFTPYQGLPYEDVADNYEGFARVSLDAAHNPALGLDRSVCLRDVVEFIEQMPFADLPRELVVSQLRRRYLPAEPNDYVQAAAEGESERLREEVQGNRALRRGVAAELRACGDNITGGIARKLASRLDVPGGLTDER